MSLSSDCLNDLEALKKPYGSFGFDVGVDVAFKGDVDFKVDVAFNFDVG